jgi:hypothetical protein
MSLDPRIDDLSERVKTLEDLVQRITQAFIVAPQPKQAAAVTEVTFTTLKFDPAKGEKLGDYEIAYQSSNIPDKFTQAYNILKQNNAIIQNRYHGQGYEYSYWIYGEGKIYRQRLKGA